MVLQAVLFWLRDLLNRRGADLPGYALSRADEREVGQGLVEYALIIVLVGVVVMAMMIVLGPAIANMYRNIIDQF